jgi:Xaa-Pro aminopeptidase
MSIDSGGNYHGYIGDICRMAIQGEPDAELGPVDGSVRDEGPRIPKSEDL